MLNFKPLTTPVPSLSLLALLASGSIVNYWCVWGNSDEIGNVTHIAWVELVAAALFLTFMIWLLLRYGKAVIASRRSMPFTPQRR